MEIQHLAASAPSFLTHWRGTLDAARCEQELDRYDTITLSQMGESALLNRMDTKFVMRECDLAAILRQMRDQYRVLRVTGGAICPYLTINYDTPCFALFLAHQNGAMNRYKIRSREYEDTAEVFLEIKLKTNKERTLKTRMPAADFGLGIDGVDTFISANSPYHSDDLVPALWTRFNRITLVHRWEHERVTADLGLRFAIPGTSLALPGVVVLEVKQDRSSLSSPFIRALKKYGIRPASFSKYCTGISLLHPELKHNRFKPTLLHVADLMREDDHDRAC